jgi:hypothetical protein
MSKKEFSDFTWDSILEKILKGQAQAHETQMFLERLSYDTRFREDFCDWIRMFRDPALAKSAHSSRGKPQ